MVSLNKHSIYAEKRHCSLSLSFISCRHMFQWQINALNCLSDVGLDNY